MHSRLFSSQVASDHGFRLCLLYFLKTTYLTILDHVNRANAVNI